MSGPENARFVRRFDSEDVSAHWRVQFSSMEKSEGASSIFFVLRNCKKQQEIAWRANKSVMRETLFF